MNLSKGRDTATKCQKRYKVPLLSLVEPIDPREDSNKSNTLRKRDQIIAKSLRA